MTLIDRLSKLDGPDREVDAQIYILFNIPAERAGRIDYANGMVGWWPKDGPYFSVVTVPAYTASVDAAIALAERVLPGWKRQLLEDFNGKWIARVCSQRRELFSTDYLRETELGGSPNAAIAICIAILRAKEASHG